MITMVDTFQYKGVSYIAAEDFIAKYNELVSHVRDRNPNIRNTTLRGLSHTLGAEVRLQGDEKNVKVVVSVPALKEAAEILGTRAQDLRRASTTKYDKQHFALFSRTLEELGLIEFGQRGFGIDETGEHEVFDDMVGYGNITFHPTKGTLAMMLKRTEASKTARLAKKATKPKLSPIQIIEQAYGRIERREKQNQKDRQLIQDNMNKMVSRSKKLQQSIDEYLAA